MTASAISALPAAVVGEGPWWDTAAQCLYWVDVEASAIHRYHPTTATHAVQHTRARVSFVIGAAAGALAIGLPDGVYCFDFQSATTRRIARLPGLKATQRLNDGKCDRMGRLWCGSSNLWGHNNPNALYRVDEKGARVMQEGIALSNGIAWSPDNSAMYYIDTTPRGEIWRFDYDIMTGTISNRTVLAAFPGETPDGMTVDSKGNLYVALWDGKRVAVLTPEGRDAGAIAVPGAAHVSSCMFGGPNLKTLYITTAKAGLKGDALAAHPESGRLFAVQNGTPGLPEARCRLAASGWLGRVKQLWQKAA